MQKEHVSCHISSQVVYDIYIPQGENFICSQFVYKLNNYEEDTMSLN